MRLASLLVLSSLAVPLVAQQPSDTLSSFQSDAQLLTYFRELRAEQERLRRERDAEYRRRAEQADKCRRDAVVLTIGSLSDSSKARGAVFSGRVLDADSAPQSSAKVAISRLGVEAIPGTDGRFRLVVPAESLIAARQVLVNVVALGFQPVSRAVTIGARDSVDLRIRLCAVFGTALLQAVTVTGAAETGLASRAAPDDQITNTQHAGVDEGGIVKVHGDHLVILRRGRLFTVGIRGSDLSAAAAVDAFGPDIDPKHTWYDELLVSGNKVVVIGYSYQRGGSEVGVFDIDTRGNLKYIATYQLRSNDYYSSRNYASRLIGTKLIFYAPLYLWNTPEDIIAALPAARRWYRGATTSAFRRIAPASRIYRSPSALPLDDIALHTVTVCDLAKPDLDCQASVVVGPSGRVFYVSPSAVYVWTSPWSWRARRAEQRGMLYRMPLDGSAPSAVGVTGTPVDQFSFLESSDTHLNVLVRANAYGDAMWAPEHSAGAMALLRIPVQSFGDGDERVPWWRYRRLPAPVDANNWTFHNRFVGSYLLYGNGTGWRRPESDSAMLYAVQWADEDTPITQLPLAHGIDRIEALGEDAVIVGATKSDLHFTGIRLTRTAAVAQRYVLPGAAQAEVRSHGFFYRMDSAASGILGLPVSAAGRAGYRHLFEGPAGIVFLRNHAEQFTPLGTLGASKQPTKDKCRASCIDWYGNARPVFMRGRIFALLGYELVEGRVVRDSIAEVRRISFAPGRQTVLR